jgi:hypothetical protein
MRPPWIAAKMSEESVPVSLPALPKVVLDDAARFTPRHQGAIRRERSGYLGDGVIDSTAEALMGGADQRSRDAQQQCRKRRIPAIVYLGPDRPSPHPLHRQFSEPLAL